MLYAYIQDVPIRRLVYEQVVAELGAEPPAGLIVHIATETENGLQYFDVWESEDASNRFTAERLHPVVGRVLERFGVQFPAQDPERRPVNLLHVWSSQVNVGPSSR